MLDTPLMEDYPDEFDNKSDKSKKFQKNNVQPSDNQNISKRDQHFNNKKSKISFTKVLNAIVIIILSFLIVYVYYGILVAILTPYLSSKYSNIIFNPISSLSNFFKAILGLNSDVETENNLEQCDFLDNNISNIKMTADAEEATYNFDGMTKKHGLYRNLKSVDPKMEMNPLLGSVFNEVESPNIDNISGSDKYSPDFGSNVNGSTIPNTTHSNEVLGFGIDEHPSNFESNAKGSTIPNTTYLNPVQDLGIDNNTLAEQYIASNIDAGYSSQGQDIPSNHTEKIYLFKILDHELISGYSVKILLFILILSIVIAYIIYRVVLMLNNSSMKQQARIIYYRFLNFMMNAIEKIPFINFKFIGRYSTTFKSVEVI